MASYHQYFILTPSNPLKQSLFKKKINASVSKSSESTYQFGMTFAGIKPVMDTCDPFTFFLLSLT